MSAMPIVFEQASLEMAVITCYACGVVFGIPQFLQRKLRENHNSFYCPNGHSQAYLGQSEAEKLRDQLKREQTALACERDLRLQAERREARIRKRVAHGVCPCCKRSFQNLKQHLATKHPDQKEKLPTRI